MKKKIGWVIFGTLVFYLLSVPLPLLLPIATLLAWMVPLLLLKELAKDARHQALMLLLIGGVALLFSASQGVFLGWKNIFSLNIPLLAMFVAISFLSLTNPTGGNPMLPSGKRAAISTGIGIHLLGAIINLSALFLFGDRLSNNRGLSKEQVVLLARSFSAAAWWSPFFIATGVAFTYAPDMHWKETLIPGAIMSAIGVCYSIVEVSLFGKKEFSGYPLKLESLVVPMFLAATVILVHLQWNQLSVLLLICMLAPVGTLLFMKGRPRLSTIVNFIDNRILTASSPFALFLAAGVFSSGIKSLTLVYPVLFSLNNLTLSPLLFAIISGGMILIGIVGVHPVISIAIISPLLLPLNPDHSQLGFLFLTSWAISTCSTPLSGIGLILVSRFSVQPKLIIKSNLLYVLIMWAIASQVNILFFDT